MLKALPKTTQEPVKLNAERQIIPAQDAPVGCALVGYDRPNTCWGILTEMDGDFISHFESGIMADVTFNCQVASDGTPLGRAEGRILACGTTLENCKRPSKVVFHRGQFWLHDSHFQVDHVKYLVLCTDGSAFAWE